MSENQLDFITEFKRQAMIAIIGLFFAGLIVAVGFYYTTASNMEKIVIEQVALKLKQDKADAFMYELNEKKINKYDYERDVDKLNVILMRMEQKIDLLE
jgi:uncharacterized membrane protein